MATVQEPQRKGALRRLKPHQLSLILGGAVGLFTVYSGASLLFFHFEDESSVQRKVLHNIPGPLILAFYTVTPVVIMYGAWMFANRVKNWSGARRRSGPPPPRT